MITIFIRLLFSCVKFLYFCDVPMVLTFLTLLQGLNHHTITQKSKVKKETSLKWRSLIVELAECTLDWAHNLLFDSIHLDLCSSKLAVVSLNWQDHCKTSWAETSQFPDFHRTPIKFSLRVLFVPTYTCKHMHLVLAPLYLMVFAKKNKTMPGLNAALELTCPS